MHKLELEEQIKMLEEFVKVYSLRLEQEQKRVQELEQECADLHKTLDQVLNKGFKTLAIKRERDEALELLKKQSSK